MSQSTLLKTKQKFGRKEQKKCIRETNKTRAAAVKRFKKQIIDVKSYLSI